MAVSYKNLALPYRMKVADVMSTQIDYVRPKDSVGKAALLIFGRNINGIPVCEGRKLVGVVTESDILSKFFPTITEYIEDSVHSSNFEIMEEKANTILSIPVKKIMSTNPTTVFPTTPLLRAQSLMNVKNIGRLPVVDKNDRLLGVVSKGDIFRKLIGDKLLYTESEDYNDFLSKTYYQTVDTEDRLIHEIPDLIKAFKDHDVKTILDVGSGTGDHIIDFAKRGYIAIGADRSQAMINEANRRKVGLSSKAYGNARFFHKDAEDLLYDLDISFDAILFMGNTISHNPKNFRHLIKKAANSLSENGVMIFQITNFDKILKAKNRLLSFHCIPTNESNTKEFAFLEFYDNPIAGKTILKTFAILSSDGNRWKFIGARNSVMVYTNLLRIKSVLRQCGMKKIEAYGGAFDGRHWDYLFRKPFKPLESNWLNIIATKK